LEGSDAWLRWAKTAARLAKSSGCQGIRTGGPYLLRRAPKGNLSSWQGKNAAKYYTGFGANEVNRIPELHSQTVSENGPRVHRRVASFDAEQALGNGRDFAFNFDVYRTSRPNRRID